MTKFNMLATTPLGHPTLTSVGVKNDAEYIYLVWDKQNISSINLE